MKSAIERLEKNKAKKAKLLAELQKLNDNNYDLKEDVLHEKFASIMKRKPHNIKISGLGYYLKEDFLDLKNQHTYQIYTGICKKLSIVLDEFQNYYHSTDHANLVEELSESSDSRLMRSIVSANFNKDHLEELLRHEKHNFKSEL